MPVADRSYVLSPEDVAEVLQSQPYSTARQCAAALRRRGYPVRRRDANSLLYRYRGRLFDHDGGEKPRWYLVGAAALAPAPVPAQPGPVDVFAAPVRPRLTGPRPAVPVPALLDDLGLRDWQRDALEAWYGAGCTGVVEAVTGTGKTHVGIAAVADTVARGQRAVVLVPGIELQQQWARVIAAVLPHAVIGMLGGGQVLRRTWDVAVAVVNTAAGERHDELLGRAELLVADECHRYGAEMFAAALRDRHVRRLGLTATYERNDNGLRDYLEPYFGEVVHSYVYEQAVPDGVVAPFALALVGVALSPGERVRYEALTQEISDAAAKLLPSCRDDEPFLQEVTRLAAHSDRIGWVARGYLKSMSDRLEVLSACAAKQDLLPRLTPLMIGGGTLVFTAHKAMAEQAARDCTLNGVRAAALHSDVPKARRRQLLEEFGAKRVDALCAPRVLDEGIDVPEADLGVVLASTRTRRQMVQRMGRVLRLKADGRHARFVIVFAQGTTEDPSTGAHEDFLEMVLSVAARHRVFGPDDDVAEVQAFLDAPVQVRVQEAVPEPVQPDVVEAEVVASLRQQLADLQGRLDLELGRTDALAQALDDERSRAAGLLQERREVVARFVAAEERATVAEQEASEHASWAEAAEERAVDAERALRDSDTARAAAEQQWQEAEQARRDAEGARDAALFELEAAREAAAAANDLSGALAATTDQLLAEREVAATLAARAQSAERTSAELTAQLALVRGQLVAVQRLRVAAVAEAEERVVRAAEERHAAVREADTARADAERAARRAQELERLLQEREEEAPRSARGLLVELLGELSAAPPPDAPVSTVLVVDAPRPAQAPAAGSARPAAPQGPPAKEMVSGAAAPRLAAAVEVGRAAVTVLPVVRKGLRRH